MTARVVVNIVLTARVVVNIVLTTRGITNTVLKPNSGILLPVVQLQAAGDSKKEHH
jgi:hypothetical protein